MGWEQCTSMGVVEGGQHTVRCHLALTMCSQPPPGCSAINSSSCTRRTSTNVPPATAFRACSSPHLLLLLLPLRAPHLPRPPCCVLVTLSAQLANFEYFLAVGSHYPLLHSHMHWVFTVSGERCAPCTALYSVLPERDPTDLTILGIKEARFSPKFTLLVRAACESQAANNPKPPTRLYTQPPATQRFVCLCGCVCLHPGAHRECWHGLGWPQCDAGVAELPGAAGPLQVLYCPSLLTIYKAWEAEHQEERNLLLCCGGSVWIRSVCRSRTVLLD